MYDTRDKARRVPGLGYRFRKQTLNNLVEYACRIFQNLNLYYNRMPRFNEVASGRGSDGNKKRKGRGKKRAVVSVGRERSRKDSETIQMVNEMLVAEDVMSLRKVAAVRGLVSDSLRRRVWPFMLDVSTTNVYDTAEESTARPSYRIFKRMSHKDDAVVKADIERSLWKYSKGWSVEERDGERGRLSDIITASLEGNTQGVYYYQGLHDVASVLLLVCGEGSAHAMLHKMVRCHLRDCTRSTIDPALRTLRLLYPILKHADRELYDFIKSLKEPALETPYFALSWYMTWFAHDVDSLEDSARLFDLFMGSHPLMPLYVACQVIVGARDDIMKFKQGEGDMVYSFLNKLAVVGPNRPNVDTIAQQAVHLYKQIPPHVLTAGKLKKDLISSCCVPFAFLKNGRWEVPIVEEASVTSHALDNGHRSTAEGVASPGIARQLQRIAIGTLAIAAGAVITVLSDHYHVLGVSQLRDWT